MANGRISRSRKRHPSAQQRLARYGNTRFGARSGKLPPHLIGKQTGERKKRGPFTIPRIALVVGTLGLAFAAVFFVVTVITSAMGVAGTLAAYREVNEELPDAASIAVDTFQTTKIYARDGELLQEVDNPDYGWRTFVSLEQMSPDFIDATVAAEDSTFWSNPGVEPVGVARAAFINVSGSGSSGASTITQQLVRSIYPDKIGFEVSYTRKGREALAAVALDQQYSKTDIMTMYVNQIYYGNRAYGIEAAAQTFFDKHATELTLAESAFLAGMPQQPSRFTEDFESAKDRQRYVLNQMVKYRYISRAEANNAWNEPLNMREVRSGEVKNAPHFSQYVRDFIIEKFGEDALYGGLEITTSIDLDLQQEAEKIVVEGVQDMEAYQRNNGAMVVMAPWSGEVLAMVGSADFNSALINGQVNYATSPIQPGSSMKPLVYAAAFEQGWNPATVILDAPTTWDSPGQPEPYEPKNYTKRSYGAVTVRTALANSLNVPAVKATEYAGLTNVMDIASDMGLKDSLDQSSDFYGLSLGLGSGEVKMIEHVNAYATLANNGTYVPPHPILKVTDSQGNVLYELDKEQIGEDSSQVIEPGHAYQVTSILSDNEAREMVFTANNLFGDTQKKLGRPTAAKSGTTENWRDLWTMGYTSDVVIGAWVGRSGDDNETSALVELDGSQAAGPIWAKMMNVIHDNPEYAELLLGPDGKPIDEKFAVPDDVSKEQVCASTGNRAGSGATNTDWIVRGEEPKNACGELTEYQQEQLKSAREAISKGKGDWASGAIQSINDYASGTGGREVAPPGSTSSDEGTSSSNSVSDDTGVSSNEPQLIEPVTSDTGTESDASNPDSSSSNDPPSSGEQQDIKPAD
jgi:membrane peptidoglycan carboxypeptidase